MNPPVPPLMRPDPRFVELVAGLDFLCLAASTSISAAILLSWLVPAVGRVLPHGWSLMKPESALGVLLCSASLVLARESRRPLLELASRLCAAVVVFLATGAILEHWGMRGMGLPSEWSAAGPMSLQTASSFVLLGLSLVIDRTRWRLLSHVMHFLILALLMLILVVIAGYMFGASDLVGQSPN